MTVSAADADNAEGVGEAVRELPRDDVAVERLVGSDAEHVARLHPDAPHGVPGEWRLLAARG